MKEVKLHPRDTMTAEERLRAVINLQVPDRVPVSPLIYYFAARYAGINNAELYDPAKFNKALDRVFYDLGPWDIHYYINAYHRELISFFVPMKVLEPGFELPPNSIRQFLEEEIMKEEDYQWIMRVSKLTPRYALYRLFMERWIPRIWEHVGEGWRSYAFMWPRLISAGLRWRLEFERWKRRGVAIMYACPTEAAFDNFSMARGMLKFVEDLRKRQEEIAQAADALVESFVYSFKMVSMITGVKRADLCLHRSSNDFISPETFRKLSLPSLKKLVERFAALGVPTVLHCDGNWDLNLEALRELPAGKAIMQCDGSTNIFKAKEIVGDRICIMGDVPADLLALGSPSEVDEYCHRLIEEVGKGGGFILASGCELAPNAKPENVKVMMESVVKYGYYQDRAAEQARKIA